MGEMLLSAAGECGTELAPPEERRPGVVGGGSEEERLARPCLMYLGDTSKKSNKLGNARWRHKQDRRRIGRAHAAGQGGNGSKGWMVEGTKYERSGPLPEVSGASSLGPPPHSKKLD